MEEGQWSGLDKGWRVLYRRTGSIRRLIRSGSITRMAIKEVIKWYIKGNMKAVIFEFYWFFKWFIILGKTHLH